MLKTPYLLLIALMILTANLVNTTGEYILANAAKTFASTEVPDTAHPELVGEAREDAIKADRGRHRPGLLRQLLFGGEPDLVPHSGVPGVAGSSNSWEYGWPCSSCPSSPWGRIALSRL